MRVTRCGTSHGQQRSECRRAETHLPAWMLAEVLLECASVEAAHMDASEGLSAEAMAPARLGAEE